jgi:phosphoglycolate phosphatase-like HAD superfamily hydrolase
MPVDAILSDWNGTLIKYRDELPLLRHIAVDVFKSLMPFHPFRMVRIIRARGQLETLYREGLQTEEFDFIRAMFDVYNDRIINGTPVSVIQRSIERYAGMQRIQQSLDHRVLQAIMKCHQRGKLTGILSAGYRYGIETILMVSGYRQYFDLFVADLLKEQDGKAVEFELAIYKRKHELLRKLIKDRGLDAGRVSYIGDSEDDEGCFEIVGYPVLAFLSPDELKNKYSMNHAVFVPENEGDLLRYLGCV